nr:hypothetical protein [Tanacetum cinerariifolium]
YEEIDEGYVTFGGNPKGGKITGKGSGPDWLFDIDALTRTMNYEPIVADTQSNSFAGTKASDNACHARKETEPVKDYILLPLWTANPLFSQDPKSSPDDGSKPSCDDGKKVGEDPRKENKCKDQEKEDNVNKTNNVNTVSSTVNTTGTNKDNELPFDPNMPALEDVSILNFLSDNDGTVADMNNFDTTIQVSYIPTTRINKDHPLDQVIKDLQSTTQTRKMSKNLEEHGFTFLIEYTRLKKHCMDYIKLLELGMKPCQHIYWTMGFKEGKLTRPYSSKGTKMSTMGELTFFLGLKVKQKKDGIFIRQDKHVAEILKKFRSMIGSLMYLTSLRHDIMFALRAYARYQVNSKVSHLYVVKRIFSFGLLPWPKLSIAQIHARVEGKEIVITESFVRRELQLADEEDIDCLPNSTIFEQLALMGDSLVRVATTASSLKVKQDSGNITKTQSKAKPNESSSQGNNSGGGPRCQETIGDTTAQTRVLDLEQTKATQKNEIDSLKRRIKKLEKRNRSRTHKLNRLYKVGLTAMVESSRDEESLGEDASKQERRIDSIDADEDITLVNDANNEMFDVDDIGGERDSFSRARLDEEVDLKLQAEFDDKERLARQRAEKEQEANIVLIEERDDIQAKIDADH